MLHCGDCPCCLEEGEEGGWRFPTERRRRGWDRPFEKGVLTGGASQHTGTSGALKGLCKPEGEL